MGNRKSRLQQSKAESEMYSAKELSLRKHTTKPPCGLDELWKDCIALRRGVERLKEAIEDIFVNDNFDNDDNQEEMCDLQPKLQNIMRSNQKLVHNLAVHLEAHATTVDQVSRNEALMTLVKHLVSTINSYNTMLIRNLLKMKRLISEINPSTEQAPTPQRNAISYAISDSQDVDAMLAQLLETEKHREDLEKDIVSLLACWRDFRFLLTVAKNKHILNETSESKAKAAAENVVRALSQLKSSKR